MTYLMAVHRLHGCYAYSPPRLPHDARGPLRCARCWGVM